MMKNYSFDIESHQSAKAVFALLLNIKKWWSGIYGETITGKSQKINDEFSFSAGEGMHFTKQKLIELIPYKKIVWEVIASNLSFLENPKEWEHTKLRFDILEKAGNKTKVTFTHQGLSPEIECYEQCSNAWTQYLNNLRENLK
ncbi:SRPBCC family protein [Arachidicoccus soli]|uniref:SRPBCC domain-containing protein n=1 Tax=Arachidicoccus soli TaxID=2341117 RepID=A0A386HMC3_9BACT|nr:SRPBCC domain-containing protein [Arachidicoccus soli]AYD47047.1 SRPBCC domain-containing protein [Arachidicoccus soli]